MSSLPAKHQRKVVSTEFPNQTRNIPIFERFYRGKNASVKEKEGNGLGLYIARNVIRDHEGELSFKDNEQGIGTTFFFSLPVAISKGSGV